ncbi:MAG: hypothetical protein IKK57_12980 [Clostridia bacterium]|nr:hypothetical protein [Clostridia bacterium]
MKRKIIALRMQRQHLATHVSEDEYDALYRDMQPGLNLYWHGFGQPPEMTFRADFDDIAYNRQRQADRRLVKGRFAGGNLGWIEVDDLPLFAALYRKPMKGMPSDVQQTILTLIERMGPLNIQQIKEETGYLVKVITPALHRLQEAFLLYEDQFDGEWDRAWYRLDEMFPDCDLLQHTRAEALEIVLQRFAYRMVWFDTKMAKSFYKLPEKELKSACTALLLRGVLTAHESGFMLTNDLPVLEAMTEAEANALPPVRAFHRNDCLVRAFEQELKERFQPLYASLPYDHDPQYYVLVDGEFRALSVGHFRYGPYEIHDIVCDSPDMWACREEICTAVLRENPGSVIQRFMGKSLSTMAV